MADTLGNWQNHSSIGTVAGQDDIAPKGTVITAQHVRTYRESVNQTAQATGAPAPTWD